MATFFFWRGVYSDKQWRGCTAPFPCVTRSGVGRGGKGPAWCPLPPQDQRPRPAAGDVVQDRVPRLGVDLGPQAPLPLRVGLDEPPPLLAALAASSLKAPLRTPVISLATLQTHCVQRLLLEYLFNPPLQAGDRHTQMRKTRLHKKHRPTRNGVPWGRAGGGGGQYPQGGG